MGSISSRTKDDFIIGDRSQTGHGPYHRGTWSMTGPAGHWAIFESPPAFLRKYIPTAIKGKILLELEIWTRVFYPAPPSGGRRSVLIGVCHGDPLLYCRRNGVQSATPRAAPLRIGGRERLFPKAKWYNDWHVLKATFRSAFSP